MVVGYGIIVFRLEGCFSLKEKRSVVKSIVSRIQNQFNISIAEVGANDIHGRAEIGFAMVGNDQRVINSKMDKVLNMAEELHLAEVIDTEMEIMVI
jgi:hypothetical protein